MPRSAVLRGLIFLGLAAFVPLPFYLAVVGGLLPGAAILLLTLRHLGEPALLAFGLGHLALYGVPLYALARRLARGLDGQSDVRAAAATALLLAALAGLGALPIYGAAHGRIEWLSAYELYASGRLR